MGTCYLQHRQVTGLFNCSRGHLKCCGINEGNVYCNPDVSAAMVFKLFSGRQTCNTGNVLFTFMIYLVCFLYLYALSHHGTHSG